MSVERIIPSEPFRCHGYERLLEKLLLQPLLLHCMHVPLLLFNKSAKTISPENRQSVTVRK